MAVIAVFNLAPATGKTTTALELARALGGFGARVLLVDLTPDGDARFAADRVCSIDLVEVLERDLPLETCIGGSAFTGVDLLSLPSVPLETIFSRAASVRDGLRDLVRRASVGYTYTVIDLPDVAGDAAGAALRAADVALVPLPAEEESLADAARMVRALEDLRQRESLPLGIALLLTMVSPARESGRVAVAIRSSYPRLVLPTAIPFDESLQVLLFRRAPGGLPSPGENAYQQATIELSRRVSASMEREGSAR